MIIFRTRWSFCAVTACLNFLETLVIHLFSAGLRWYVGSSTQSCAQNQIGCIVSTPLNKTKSQKPKLFKLLHIKVRIRFWKCIIFFVSKKRIAPFCHRIRCQQSSWIAEVVLFEVFWKLCKMCMSFAFEFSFCGFLIPIMQDSCQFVSSGNDSDNLRSFT